MPPRAQRHVDEGRQAGDRLQAQATGECPGDGRGQAVPPAAQETDGDERQADHGIPSDGQASRASGNEREEWQEDRRRPQPEAGGDGEQRPGPERTSRGEKPGQHHDGDDHEVKSSEGHRAEQRHRQRPVGARDRSTGTGPPKSDEDDEVGDDRQGDDGQEEPAAVLAGHGIQALHQPNSGRGDLCEHPLDGEPAELGHAGELRVDLPHHEGVPPVGVRPEAQEERRADQQMGAEPQDADAPPVEHPAESEGPAPGPRGVGVATGLRGSLSPLMFLALALFAQFPAGEWGGFVRHVSP
jgi:hypothetical protein